MIPNKPGVWLHKPSGDEIDIYDLEPVGCLCLWGPDVGAFYAANTEEQMCWTTDEWQGHIPVHRFDYFPENWEFLRAFNQQPAEQETTTSQTPSSPDQQS